MFVTYNGINLALTNIDNVQRDTIFSDDGTTVLYTEVTVSLSAVYHLPIGGIPNLGGTSVGNQNLRIVPGSPAVEPFNAQPRNTPDGVDPATGGFPSPDMSPPFASFPGMPGGTGTLNPSFPSPGPTVATPVSSGANPLYPQGCSLPDPGVGGWRGPIVTDRELELYLRTPRQKLIIWGFDTNGSPITWIESPRAGMPVDAKVGPVTLGCHVRNGPNSNSFFVSMDIRTWLTPCEDSSDRVILSHRWRMTHNEDEAHYLTRQVEGTVVFNPGPLLATGFDPDWFRAQFFHPIPLGFQRSLGPITLSPDGTTLKYAYSDTDTTIVFDNGGTGAIHIDISEQISYTNPWRGIFYAGK